MDTHDTSFSSFKSYINALSDVPRRLRRRAGSISTTFEETTRIRSRSGANMTKNLRWYDLICFGIGGMVGAGVFVTSGIASHDKAGPAVILSYAVAGLCALLSAFCYTEFAVHMPDAGGAFSYIRVTFGEFTAFLVGANLVMDYVLSNAAAARSFTTYLGTAIGVSAESKWRITVSYLPNGFNQIDIIAVLIILILTVIICYSTRESSVLNMILTAIHILFIIFVIMMGFWKGDIKNFTEPSDPNNPGGFFPFGAVGVFNGAALVYVSYIGYDAVSTLAEEVKNPVTDIPIGVSGSVILVTVLYCLMAASMSMLLPYDLDYVNVTTVFDLNQTIERLDYLDQEEAENSTVPRAPRRYIPRDRVAAAERLWNDYFADNSVFPLDYFRRRFRMSKPLFIRICQAIHFYNPPGQLPSYFDYFRQKRDATGYPSFNVFQKCTSAIRQLAYGCAADLFDEYLHMGQQTAYGCLDNFCKCIFHLYSTEFLRKPTTHDVQRLHAKHQEIHGFPGMLGSIDCMHWPWKNCPTAWQGQYTRGDQGCPTIMLEAVASYDLWIWHAYFGPAGSNNDINVLNESDLFDEIRQDRSPVVLFTISGEQFTKGYYLADGIYPEWAMLVKSFKCPIEEKNMKFKRFQESARKDVERAFGVLQGRWAIIKNPARPYSVNKIRRIMYTCVILHNMITEDNGRAICPIEEDYTANPDNHPQRTWHERVAAQLRIEKEIRDRVVHHKLCNALIEHIWTLPPNYRQR